MTAYEDILRQIPPALLVIFRIGGLMVFAPVLGSSAIPVRVKVLLGFILGLAVYPIASRHFDAGAVPPLELWSLAPLVASELLVGVLVGFVAALPLVSVQLGGLVMGQQMGLGFARFYNPGIDDEADVVGQLLFFMALAGFLMIGGLDATVLAVLRSFDYVPLGGFAVDGDAIRLITGLLLAAFELALRVGAPVLALIFLQSVAMGFMAKTVPQLNILSLGFALRIIIGTGAVMVGLVVIDDVVMDGINDALDALFTWIQSQTPAG